MAVSSLPETSLTVKFGASATALRSTNKLPDTDSVSPLISVAVAVTVRLKSTSLSAGGVIVRFSN